MTKTELKRWKQYRTELDKYNEQVIMDTMEENRQIRDECSPYWVLPPMILPNTKQPTYEDFLDWMVTREDDANP